MEPSTKDTTHLRRSKGKLGRMVIPALSNPLCLKESDFLLNNNNKMAFILMLGEQQTHAGIDVGHATGDADLPIVTTALEISERILATVAGEDTDLLVLLLHYYNSTIHHHIYLLSHANEIIWEISKAKEAIGSSICEALLVIHVICGCDTTSRVHSLGAQTVLQKFIKNKVVQQLINLLSTPELEKRTVLEAGGKLLLLLLGGKTEQNLDKLHSRKYYDKISGATRQAVKPETLGRTTDAA